MIHSLSRPIGSVLVVSVLSACGADLGRDRAPPVIIDSAGVTIVESSSPAWAGNGRRIEREPILRIGSENREAYQFGFVATGLVLPNEQLVVAEGMTREIRIFDFSGNHVLTVGRSGEGPGEFRTIAGVFRYRGDSIAVYDQLLRSTTIFPGMLESQRVLRNPVEGNFLAFGALKSGRILLFNPGRGFRPDLSPGLQWDTTDVVVVDPAGGSSRVVARLASRQQVVEADGNTRRLIPAHNSIQAVADDGFYWATTDRYEIGFYDRDGTLRCILRRPVEPRAVEPSMVDAYIEAVLDRVRQREGDGAVPRYRQMYDDAWLGETVPLFGRAFVDANERLWISRSVWPALQAAPGHWSVFSPDGIWLGDLEAPERLMIVDSRGDLVLGVWRDELDVPHVQLHRIVAAEGP